MKIFQKLSESLLSFEQRSILDTANAIKVSATILAALLRRRGETVLRRRMHRPPLNAEFLFYLCMSRVSADALVGDLEQGYKSLYRKFGFRHARFWYWLQTFISLRPIIWAAIKKPLATLATMAAAKGLIGHDGWLAAVVEFVKRVRS